jgi:hypothetical protein
MVELLTPHLCLFGAPLASCWRSGYELLRPPASASFSATCDLTTLWVLCVCDDHFCVVRNHPCRWWCPLEFRSRRCVVRDSSSARFEPFFLSNSVPRPVSFPCANTDSQMSLSLPCWIPWLSRKLIDCWFVTARKRRSSSRGYGNCFRLANAGVMPIWKPSWSMPHVTAGSFHKLFISVAVSARVYTSISIQMAQRLTSRGQSHSRIVTQCFASTHLARACTPVLSDLREGSEASAVSKARLTNTFGGRLATWMATGKEEICKIQTRSWLRLAVRFVRRRGQRPALGARPKSMSEAKPSVRWNVQKHAQQPTAGNWRSTIV